MGQSTSSANRAPLIATPLGISYLTSSRSKPTEQSSDSQSFHVKEKGNHKHHKSDKEHKKCKSKHKKKKEREREKDTRFKEHWKQRRRREEAERVKADETQSWQGWEKGTGQQCLSNCRGCMLLEGI